MRLTVNRRTILTAGVTGLVAGPLWQKNAMSDPLTMNPDDEGHRRAAAFADSLARDPRWKIFHGLTKDHPQPVRLKTRGAWPSDLKGRFLRAVPAGLQRFGQRVDHWFDGDGLIEEFRIEDGQVHFRSRFVDTAKRRQETEAGRWLYTGFGTKINDPVLVRRPDDMNVANINLLYHAGQLMALWEGGSPTLLSQDSLARLGLKTWREDMKGIPFTAHPRKEANGQLWAFGYDLLGQRLIVMKIAKNGDLQRVEIVPVRQLGMIHDFVITQNHLVFFIHPLVFNLDRFHAEKSSVLDSHDWKPELGTRALIIAKNDFQAQRWINLPPRFLFHHGNGWEEADGTIRLDAWTYPDPTIAKQTTRLIMQGNMFIPDTAKAKLALIRIPPSGKGSELREQDDIRGEFPRIDPQRIGQRNDYLLYLAAQQPRSDSKAFPWFEAIAMRNLDDGQEKRFEGGQDSVFEEHIVISRRDKPDEKDSWIIGTRLNPLAQQTVLSLFKGAGLDEGPIAEAIVPETLTYGLHAIFIPA